MVILLGCEPKDCESGEFLSPAMLSSRSADMYGSPYVIGKHRNDRIRIVNISYVDEGATERCPPLILPHLNHQQSLTWELSNFS